MASFKLHHLLLRNSSRSCCKRAFPVQSMISSLALCQTKHLVMAKKLFRSHHTIKPALALFVIVSLDAMQDYSFFFFNLDRLFISVLLNCYCWFPQAIVVEGSVFPTSQTWCCLNSPELLQASWLSHKTALKDIRGQLSPGKHCCIYRFRPIMADHTIVLVSLYFHVCLNSPLSPLCSIWIQSGS